MERDRFQGGPSGRPFKGSRLSGIFGIWNFDGRPVERATLDAMAATIPHRGGDALDFWIKDGVGFGCHLRRVTPESQWERQPAVDDYGNVLLFDGRIDNRIELLGSLGPERNADQLSDADLVMMTLPRWGRKFAARLAGEFAIAAFEPGEQRLVLARDPVGCRPLYYWRSAKCFVFASEIKAILAHPEIASEPNLDLLADALLLDHLPYEDDGDTFFSGIQRIVPGSLMVVAREKYSVETFWDFDPDARIRRPVYSDYVLNLRELLTRAVRRRMRSNFPVAIGVSGGLDSSVVLSIAHQIGKKQSPEPDIIPISYAPLSDQDSEENRFIRLMESHCGRTIHRLEMGAPGDLQHLGDAAWYSETPFFDDSWCAETPLLEYARNHGARTLLTGLWSDQFMFVTGYLVDLWKRFAWRKVMRHLREYSRWFEDCDPGYFRSRFYREMALNLTPRSIRSMAKPLYGRARSLGPNRSWVGRTLLNHARRSRSRVSHPHYASVHARSIYQAAHAKSHRLAFDADGIMAARYGLERTSPFLDRDVISFLMAIPGEIQNQGGVPRGLLRAAVRGLVPREVRLRQWRDEGTASSKLERERGQVYREPKPGPWECKRLGVTYRPDLSDSQYLDLMGLEFWVRAFFSDSTSRASKTRGISAAV